jgi:tRNA (guanine-N7-)-methyltransferase
MSWAFHRVWIDATRSALPLDWGFERGRGTLLVEVGFGNGEHLVRLARSRPDARVVGIEVSQGSLFRAARRLLTEGIDNARLLWGDARFLLDAVFAPGSVDRLVMNFPCPWPKKRHAGRRVTSAPFCRRLARVLRIGGRFDLTTDLEEVVRESEAGLAEVGAFGAPRIERNPPLDWTTKYGRKWREMGRDWFTLSADKVRDVPGGSTVPVEEAVLVCEESPERPPEKGLGAGGPSGKPDGDACPERVPLLGEEETGSRLRALLQRTGRRGSATWVFKDLFRGEGGIFLIRTIVADEGFEQRFFVKVAPGRAGMLVQVDGVGGPFRTPSVRLALREVEARLRGSESA